jgi:alkyldihydroxyacetonephosphate synthase
MVTRLRKFWGWGYEDGGLTPDEIAGIVNLARSLLGAAPIEPTPPPRIEELQLPAPRITPPPALASVCSASTYDRAGHAYGKSFRDVVRGLRRDYARPPDFVAFPASESELCALLDFCSSQRVAAVPYGGGSSVVGGVETAIDGDYRGVVSIDLSKLDRVLELDRTSRAARIQAGVLGPALEDQLRPHGFTLRHYPQSFELSSLGGWIATRAGGHFATLYTHIDDLVEALRVITPAGMVVTRRVPASGAGPSPDRLFLGSEGTLGIITEAWMRLQERPRFRNQATVRFASFESGAEAVRRLGQSGLYPTNCRLVDAREASFTGAGDGSATLLIVAFESHDHEVDAWMARALQCCRDAGGQAPDDVAGTRRSAGGDDQGPASAWRRTFLLAPYIRDVLVAHGFITETFESACTWDAFPAFHARVMAATRDAVKRVCGAGEVTCRITHVYPDGPAPYYTVFGLSELSSQLEQWSEIKAAAADAIMAGGGTITHHHAVGRDHRPWYDRERPELFAGALRAAKSSFDPAWILNPGVLLDRR